MRKLLIYNSIMIFPSPFKEHNSALSGGSDKTLSHSCNSNNNDNVAKQLSRER